MPKSPEPEVTCDNDARKYIIGILREKCPTGFMNENEKKACSKLTTRQRNKILKMAQLHPASLNISDIDGRTPLAWLSRYDEPKLLADFLVLGANPRGFGRDKIHPLAQACELRSGESLAILALAVDIDESVDDYPGELKGATAIFFAAMNCNKDGIETLLELGADPLLTSDAGDTAMHALAYYEKNVDRAGPCALVLAAAAPELWTIKNKKGQTPRDLALQFQSEMAPFFQAMEDAFELSKNISSIKANRQSPSL